MRGPLPEDLLIEPLGRHLRLHGEATLQDSETDLVLPECGRPPTQLDVETHDGAMGRLLQWVQSEKPERRLQRCLRRARGALVPEELGQRFERQLVQSLALREEPLLEGGLPEGQALQELAAIEGGGALEGGRRGVGDPSLELGDVHVDGVRVQSDGLSLDQQGRWLDAHGPPKREQ